MARRPSGSGGIGPDRASIGGATGFRLVLSLPTGTRAAPDHCTTDHGESRCESLFLSSDPAATYGFGLVGPESVVAYLLDTPSGDTVLIVIDDVDGVAPDRLIEAATPSWRASASRPEPYLSHQALEGGFTMPARLRRLAVTGLVDVVPGGLWKRADGVIGPHRVHRLRRQPSRDLASAPPCAAAASPDSALTGRIVFEDSGQDFKFSQVWIENADGSDLQQLVKDEFTDVAPAPVTPTAARWSSCAC